MIDWFLIASSQVNALNLWRPSAQLLRSAGELLRPGPRRGDDHDDEPLFACAHLHAPAAGSWLVRNRRRPRQHWPTR